MRMSIAGERSQRDREIILILAIDILGLAFASDYITIRDGIVLSNRVRQLAL